MFELISVTRTELEICESFYKTKQDAINAMVEDILISTSYKSLEEIIEDADAGLCGFSDDEAWAETNQHDTGQWKIVKIPEKAETVSKERVIQILQDYLNRDLDEADPEFVKNTLKDTCGCTVEELKELGLYDWLGFED